MLPSFLGSRLFDAFPESSHAESHGGAGNTSLSGHRSTLFEGGPYHDVWSCIVLGSLEQLCVANHGGQDLFGNGWWAELACCVPWVRLTNSSPNKMQPASGWIVAWPSWGQHSPLPSRVCHLGFWNPAESFAACGLQLCGLWVAKKIRCLKIRCLLSFPIDECVT